MSNWSGRDPRRWQVEAFAAYAAARDAGALSGGVFAACTGSGKSIHLAEVVADLLTRVQSPGVVVVTTPTVLLVEQLSATLTARLGEPVGVHYTDGKFAGERVVVTCHASFAHCLKTIDKAGRHVAFWCADECHKTDNAQMLVPSQQMANVDRVGWSATPYKSDPDPSKGLTLWLHELYRYPITQAIEDKALVPWRTTGLGQFDALRVNQLAAEADRLAPDDEDREEYASEQQSIVDAASVRWIKRQSGPGVVSSRNVVDAEAFAKRLVDEGVRALAIHANQSRSIRAARLEALQKGELDCLVHVQVLVEGVDLPWLRWGCLRRVRSRVGFVQEVGRFLRSAPGKDVADLFDPFGLFVRHGIDHPSQLDGAAVEVAEEVEEEAEAVETVEVFDPLTGKTYRVPREIRSRTPVQRVAIAHVVSMSFISDCVSWLRAKGLIDNRFAAAGNWRSLPATKAQLDLLARRKGKFMMLKKRPEAVAKAIAHAYDLLLAEHQLTVGEPTLRRGILTDFLSLDQALNVRRSEPGWDTSAQDATIAALADCPVDTDGVITATNDAKRARRHNV